jgi:hypothetical protein
MGIISLRKKTSLIAPELREGPGKKEKAELLVKLQTLPFGGGCRSKFNVKECNSGNCLSMLM